MSYSFSDLFNINRQAGFDPVSAGVGAAIELAESGGNPKAVGDQGTSYGLWQIHLPAHPDVSVACAEDPVCATKAAFGISSRGTNWAPWSTFTSGAYRQYLGGTDSLPPLPNPAQAAGDIGGALQGLAGSIAGIPAGIANAALGGVESTTKAASTDLQVWAKRNAVALFVALAVALVLFGGGNEMAKGNS